MQEPVVEGYRLSPQQRRLWLRGSSPAYRAQCALRLEGPLEEQTLREAIEIVVGRHQILRTAFPRVPGMAVPLQVIGEPDRPPRTIDVAGGEKDDEILVEDLLRRQAEPGFDIERGPVLRAALCRISPATHLLILTLPALCADARTLGNLVGEIARAYRDAGRAPHDAGEPTQYLQFSEWQNELTEGSDEDAEAGRGFWRRQLATRPPALPWESVPDAGTEFAPAELAVHLDAGPAAVGLRSPGSPASDLSAFFLSCWQTLLWRLTGQAEIRVDTVFSGRKYAELDEVLGLLAASLPVRARFEPGMRFADLLRRTRDAMQEAEGWQEYFSGDEDGRKGEAEQPIGFLFVDGVAAEDAGQITVSWSDGMSARSRTS